MSENNDVKVAKEAHAYTPGLKIMRILRIRKLRRLPIPGEVLVKVGDEVDFMTPVAEAMIPGEPHVVNAVAQLGVEQRALEEYLKVKVGDKVKEGQDLAGFNALFGLWKNWVKSPVDGVVETISTVSGQIIIREEPVPVTVDSFIKGRVTEIMADEGAYIETDAAYIQGIFGVGGEAHGEIKIISEDVAEPITVAHITEDCRGKILVGGSIITREALHKAVTTGVAGIMTGGIIDVDLEDLLGYEIGVAITGQEELGFTLMITEGFGEMAMNPRTLSLLKEFEGERAAINGATQIRAGVLRPEIIIPHSKEMQAEAEDELASGMKPGTKVRIIREPYFGALGAVVSLPVELQEVESESSVRVIEIELEDGSRVVVPRANVEIIET
jgi:biotin carboxyl carrier protein